MREISACGSAPAGVGTARSKAVDPHAHHEAGAERLDVDVGRAQLHRLFEQIVDGAHHRRAAREVAQALHVIVGARERGFAGLRLGGCVVAEPLGQDRGDVFIRGDLDPDAAAEHDLGGARRRHVVWIGDGDAVATFGCLIGEHQGLAQEAAREPFGERRGGEQLQQRHAR